MKPYRQLAKSNKDDLFKTLRRIFRLICGVVAFVGSVLAFSTLIPRMSVAVCDPLDQANPFSSSATIFNNGYVPLDGVKIGFALKQIVLRRSNGSTLTLKGDGYESIIYRDTWEVPHLGLDDRLTIGLNDILALHGQAMIAADFAVVISYRLPVINQQLSKVYPFHAKRLSNGQIAWYSYPMIG